MYHPKTARVVQAIGVAIAAGRLPYRRLTVVAISKLTSASGSMAGVYHPAGLAPGNGKTPAHEFRRSAKKWYDCVDTAVIGVRGGVLDENRLFLAGLRS